jgi:fatty acid desaturase
MSSKTTATSTGTVQTPENENSLVASIVLYVVMMALFLGAIYSLSFLSLGNPWPMAVCLVLFALAFWIPQTILGRSDSAGEH